MGGVPEAHDACDAMLECAMAENEERYSIKPVHDTLFVTLRGSWSMDNMRQFTEDYKKLVGRYFAREWACVLNIRDLELLIGEDQQIAAFKALNTWSFIKGMQAQAVILSDRNPGYLLYQFEEILKDKASFDRKVFLNERDADHWLVNKGFSEKLEFESQKSA